MKLNDKILEVMKEKKVWKSHEIQSVLALRHKLYSESTITRRLRAIPQVIASKPNNGERAWDYQIIN